MRDYRECSRFRRKWAFQPDRNQTVELFVASYVTSLEISMNKNAVVDVLSRAGEMGTVEVAAYVASMLEGLRQLTGTRRTRDIAFLDDLLATAEEEAKNLTTRIYN